MKSSCIEIDTLDRYIDGSLSEQEKAQTETHFLKCDRCLEKFIIAREMVSDPELICYQPTCTHLAGKILQSIREKAAAFTEKVKRVLRWLPDLSVPEWAGAAVRSGEAIPTGSVFVKKKMANLQTEIFVQKTEDNKARILIKVFQGNKGAKYVNLKFGKQEKRPGETLLCREEDIFDKKIPFGAYHLTLEQASTEKGTYLFTIRTDGLYEE